VFRRGGLSLLLAICFFGGSGVACENRVLAEVRFVAHSSAEKNAGVWVMAVCGLRKRAERGQENAAAPRKARNRGSPGLVQGLCRTGTA